MARWICPECREPVVKRAPWRNLKVWGNDRDEWAHRDGEPLCPVMGNGRNGYVSAKPVKVR